LDMDVLIGRLSSMSSKLVLESFMIIR
jgi:hypothetical protein